VVTGATVLVHKNEKVGVEITPRTRRWAAVERSGNQGADPRRPRPQRGALVLRSAGRSVRLGDDMRAVIRSSDSEANHP
jgi:hypothetical protein